MIQDLINFMFMGGKPSKEEMIPTLPSAQPVPAQIGFREISIASPHNHNITYFRSKCVWKIYAWLHIL